MSCQTYRVEVDGCVDGLKTVAVDLYAGLQGATGPSGIPSTIPGPVGPSGAQGPVGATGPAGAQGLVGATGPSGAQGHVGATGIPGSVGATGPSGAQGHVGATGIPGSVGATGPSGVQGLVGATGPSGAQGAVGATGPAPSSASATFATSRFVGDGITPSFGPLTGFQTGDGNASFESFLDGIVQDPDPTNGAFVIAANSITFASPPPLGVQIVVRKISIAFP